jgi:threonine efflux protein
MSGWFHEWLIFVGVMALGQFSPGPDMILLTRTSLASGRWAGCATALGIAFGLGFHALIAVTGVAFVLGRGGWFETVMYWAAAMYLTWIAVPLIRQGLKAKALALKSSRLPGDGWSCWKRGLFCNLLNLKVAIFLAGVTAPFLSISEPPPAWPLILWLTIVLEGGILWCLWAWALQMPAIKMRYQKVAHWFDLAFGLALMVVAGMLVFIR